MMEFTLNRTMGMTLWKAYGVLPLSAHFPRGAFAVLRDARFEHAVTVTMPTVNKYRFYETNGTGNEHLERDDLLALREVLIAASKRPTFATTRQACREAADVCTKMLGLSAIDQLSELVE